VFCGDAGDLGGKGSNTNEVLSHLLGEGATAFNLAEKSDSSTLQTGMTHCVVGNRDLNKLRIWTELLESGDPPG